MPSRDKSARSTKKKAKTAERRDMRAAAWQVVRDPDHDSDEEVDDTPHDAADTISWRCSGGKPYTQAMLDADIEIFFAITKVARRLCPGRPFPTPGSMDAGSMEFMNSAAWAAPHTDNDRFVMRRLLPQLEVLAMGFAELGNQRAL